MCIHSLLRDIDLIVRLVEVIKGPINILAGASSPSVPKLQNIGVARVSIGGLFSLMSYTQIRMACREIDNHGTYDWAKDVILHPEMNRLLG